MHTMKDSNIGFIGLGNMGSEMCLNIIRHSYKVTVHDINKEAALPALEMGASWADTPKEISEECDIVFTCLPGPTEVEAVAIGKNGILEGAGSSTVWVDLSTSSPQLIRELHKTFSSKGALVLDAPVSGGVAGAAKGHLAIMVGGDKDTFIYLKPIFGAFGDKVTYTGPIGTGSICKLMHNTVGYGMEMILSECLTLGVKAGIDAATLVECIRNGSVGRGNLLNVSLPETYFQGKFDPPNFTLKGAKKDMALALELARDFDVPVAAATHAYNELTSAVNKGWGHLDARISFLLQEERAGNIEVRLPKNN